MNWMVGRPSGCRWVNSVAILELLRDRGPLSRAEIARYLGLNPASVSRILDELLAKGVVLERDEIRSRRGVGRPPSPVIFNARVCSVISVDMGGTFTRAALLDLEGSVLRRTQARTEPGRRGFIVLMKVLEELLSSDDNCPQVGAIALGIPGVVRPEEGVVVFAPALGWRNFPCKRLLEERFGVPVVVENDVNLHALGEHWKGAGRGTSHLVCVFVGTGIGAGIVVNGQLYRGSFYYAGEIGYIVPDVRYLGRAFQKFGCLEHLSAGYGLARRGRAAVRRGKGAGILKHAESPENVEATHVLTAAREGDVTAQRLVEEAQRYLAIALISLTCALNPELIILGGGIVESGVFDLQRLQHWVELAVPMPPQITFSVLGSDAGLLGGVALALRSKDFLAALLERSCEGVEVGQKKERR